MSCVLKVLPSLLVLCFPEIRFLLKASLALSSTYYNIYNG